MENVKTQFLNYLRSYYGAESMTSNGSLPPIKAGPNYPAFRKETGLNALMGLGSMEGMEPMGGMGGFQQPMMGQGPAPQRQRLGGPREDAQEAQRLLLGR